MMARKENPPLYHYGKKPIKTIYAISREYNVPVNRLLKLNPTLKNDKVRNWAKNQT